MDWKNQLVPIINKVKYQLHSRKMDDLEGVYNLIQEFDPHQTKGLDKVTFGQLLSKAGIYLTTQELTCIYNLYDPNRSGYVDYGAFFQAVRSDISDKRLATVRHAFQFIGEGKESRLSIADLLRNYRAEDHPRVRTREKDADQVRAEFKNSILKKSYDGAYITESEFLDYYADVNATLPKEKEDYFVDLVLKTWGVTTGADYVSPERMAELEDILYEKIRQKTLTKEDEAKTAKKAFRFFDINDSGVIDLQKFTSGLERFGCVFGKHEIWALFKKYDSSNSNQIYYDDFCKLFLALGSGVVKNTNVVFNMAKEYPIDVIELTRRDCKKKGLYGVRDLSQLFKKVDKFQKGSVSRNEFLWIVKEAGTSLTKHDLDKIFRYFDKQSNNIVSYGEFVALVRGELSDLRSESIREAWLKMAPSTEEPVPFHDFMAAFDPYGQHDVKIGKTKADKAVKDFISQWESKKGSSVSFKDFFDFFWDVSAVINEDEGFEVLMRDSWKALKPQNKSLEETLSPSKTAKGLSVRFADQVNIK